MENKTSITDEVKMNVWKDVQYHVYRKLNMEGREVNQTSLKGSFLLPSYRLCVSATISSSICLSFYPLCFSSPLLLLFLLISVLYYRAIQIYTILQTNIIITGCAVLCHVQWYASDRLIYLGYDSKAETTGISQIFEQQNYSFSHLSSRFQASS